MEDLEEIYPLWWHFDGAEVYSNSEYLVWSWSCPLAKGGFVLDEKLICLYIPHWMCSDGEVQRKLHEVIAKFIGWMMGVLRSGVMPSKGFYNETLTGVRAENAGKPLNFKMVLTGWKGDGKACKETHNCERNYLSTFVCKDCLACQPFKNSIKELDCYDFSEDAPHRATVLTHRGYLSMPGANISPWVKHVPGFTKDMIMRDFMHVGPLGFLRDIAGSTIVELIESGTIYPELTQEKAAQKLWSACKVWCKLSLKTNLRVLYCVGKYVCFFCPPCMHMKKDCHIGKAMYISLSLLCSSHLCLSLCTFPPQRK